MKSRLIIKSFSLKAKNEDFITIAHNSELNLKAIILGDGIGSHYKPDEGAKLCVTSLKKNIETCETLSQLDLKRMFELVYDDLREAFDSIEDESIDKSQAYGTTLICAIELDEKYIIAYAGNGSAWHIRGNFHDFSAQRYFPWNALNVLNPHTVEENGKEALYKFFALKSSEEQILPTIIEISKDNRLFGDIILISTDGLYSNDHNPVAKDREGNLWIAGERKMELMLNRLKALVTKSDIEQNVMEGVIDEYIKEIQAEQLIDDDITFGIIFNHTLPSDEL